MIFKQTLIIVAVVLVVVVVELLFVLPLLAWLAGLIIMREREEQVAVTMCRWMKPQIRLTAAVAG